MKHKWNNVFFRGVESSSKQVCIACGTVKDNTFIPARYIQNGLVRYTAGICTTPAIEQMAEESVHASKQIAHNQNF